jgi:hypothetical protein
MHESLMVLFPLIPLLNPCFHISRGQILYKIMENLANGAKELGSNLDG